MNELKYIFDFKKFYRYCYIGDYIKNKDLLDYFYGDDRSYRQACPFDNGDFIVEFDFVNSINNGFKINHHPLSYRGLLNKDNTIISKIYINNKKDFYCSQKSLRLYLENINILLNKLPENFKSIVSYYDDIIESDMNKIPKNNFTIKFKNYLIYQGLA